jgi:hypothetical protein
VSGKEEEFQGILASGGLVPASKVDAPKDADSVKGSANDKHTLQQSSIEGYIPSAVSAAASPLQQTVGHDVTITGQLIANDAPLNGAVVRLYVEGADLWFKISETTTNEVGGFAFRVQQPTAGPSSFKIVFPGSANYKPSMSEELQVTFVAIPTTITVAAIPQPQVIGQNVAIKGQVSASGTPLGDVHITLYNADDVIERVPVAATKTDPSGTYQFILSETTPGRHSYVVHAPSTSTHAAAESASVLIVYVNVPTSITAVVTPREQCVGHDVTITGQLTAGGNPLPDSPVILYNAADVAQRAAAAETMTDDAGYYQFRVKDTSPGRHTYVVHAPARGTYAAAQTAEIVVACLAIPTAITATAVARQQEVIITGQLTAGGNPLPDSPVTLYNADDVTQNVPIAETKTNVSGYYEFSPLTQTAATGHVYRVYYAGDDAHTSAQSTDVLVHYGTPPAEAAPLGEASCLAAKHASVNESLKKLSAAPVAAPQKSKRLARGEVVLLVVAAIIVAVAILVMRL